MQCKGCSVDLVPWTSTRRLYISIEARLGGHKWDYENSGSYLLAWSMANPNQSIWSIGLHQAWTTLLPNILELQIFFFE